MTEKTIDLRRVGVLKRHERLMAAARFTIIGPGAVGMAKEGEPGLDVNVNVSGGQVCISIDGINIFEITGAERVECTTRSYS